MMNERSAERKTNVKKGKKEDPKTPIQAYKPHLDSWKGDQQIILETISRHMKEKKSIRNSQHGFTKRKLCLTNLISFYSEITGFLDGGESEYFLPGFQYGL